MAVQAETSAGADDSRMSNLIISPDMVAALRADGPTPSLATELSLFGRFVGAWNLEIDFWPRDEPAWSTDGVWLFDWILDGRGIQDVILHTTRTGQVGRGSTIRLYDPVEGVWRMGFFGPISRTYVLLTARAQDDAIRIDGREGHDLLRWSFEEITDRSFLWRGYVSADGASWHYEQEMRATRR
jgi:hypothetical protein